MDAKKASNIISDFIGFQVETETVLSFIQYFKLLVELNEELNLIRVKDWDDFLYMHILDSISPLKWGLIEENSRFCDLGSGGGLPGIPIKIMLPRLNTTLLDSKRKKVSALSRIAQALNLSGTETIWGRAEELARKKTFKFDCVTARAVGKEGNVIPVARGLLKERGICIIYATEGMKNSDIHEIGHVVEKYKYTFLGLRKERELRVIRSVPRGTQRGS